LLPSVPSPPDDAGATPTIKGLSLPTKNPIGEQDEETDAAAPEQEDEVPAWLHELGASLSEEDRTDDPDHLEDAGEVPDWLRDLRASLPEESEDQVEPAGEEEKLPDWLAAPESMATEPEMDPASGEREPEPEGQDLEPVSESQVSEPEFKPQPPEPDALAEIESEAEPLAPEPEEDEVPGWLSRLVPTAAVAGPETELPTSEEEEAPGWLSRLVPGEAEAETEPAHAAPEAKDGKGAGWLDKLVPETPAAELEPGEGEAPRQQDEFETLPDEVESQLAPASAEIEEGEIPDWMAELQPEDEEAEPELSVTEIEEGEVPDWMAELRPEDEEAEAEPAPSAIEIEEGEIPDWMAELRPEDEEAEAEPVPSAAEIEEGEVPDWMAELRPVGEEAELEPVASAIEIEGEEFPDRVTELEPPSEEFPLAETLDSLDEVETEPLAEEPAFKLPEEVEAILGPAVPAWLAELQVEAPDAAAAIIEETMVDGELPEWLVRSEPDSDKAVAPAEIPGWLLVLKPTELREEGEEEEVEVPSPTAQEASEETGLLAGIQGALPVEMLIAQPRAIAAAESLDMTIDDSPPARLFAEIVGRPPDAAPKEIARRTADVLPRTARWIIYAILIAVVSVPILVGEPLLPRTIEPPAATVDMHRAIESLGSGDPVLVAFDYDPTSSGEMDLIARALIGHLMDREARVVVVSLLPAGPATAQLVLDELVADRPGYAEGYGQRYVNLGYLPGQAAAVRLLGLSLETALPRDFYGTPLSDLPVMQGLDSTQAFALIVELAAAQDSLRWWIEQAGTPFAIPLGAGTSASVIPIARPYYETESRQLVGLVGGVLDAATYEALTSDQNSPTSSTAARLDSQLAGQLVFILVILAGNVVYFSRRGTRRER
jgi:hypothetical protein